MGVNRKTRAEWALDGPGKESRWGPVKPCKMKSLLSLLATNWKPHIAEVVMICTDSKGRSGSFNWCAFKTIANDSNHASKRDSFNNVSLGFCCLYAQSIFVCLVFVLFARHRQCRLMILDETWLAFKLYSASKKTLSRTWWPCFSSSRYHCVIHALWIKVKVKLSLNVVVVIVAAVTFIRKTDILRPLGVLPAASVRNLCMWCVLCFILGLERSKSWLNKNVKNMIRYKLEWQLWMWFGYK